MRWIVAIVIFVVIAGCGVAQQPESIRTVAAFEVPLPSEADREQFLSVLRAAAEAAGMHVDCTNKQELEREGNVSPAFKMTMRAAVWRDTNEDEVIASAMDQHDHLGQVWIMLSRGRDPALASRFRERAMRTIMLHWPDTLSLPIMPTGWIPLHADLIRTPAGYIVNPAAASRYGMDTEKQPQ